MWEWQWHTKNTKNIGFDYLYKILFFNSTFVTIMLSPHRYSCHQPFFKRRRGDRSRKSEHDHYCCHCVSCVSSDHDHHSCHNFDGSPHLVEEEPYTNWYKIAFSWANGIAREY